MKLYLVCDDPQVDADIAIHTGRTITIRGRGKTRLPDCSSVEFAKEFYKKLRNYKGIKLAVDMSDEVPPPPSPEEKKEETPPPPENKEEVPPLPPPEQPADDAPAPEQPAETKADLQKKTKPQLIELAKAKGLDLDFANLSKAQLIEKLI